MTSYFLDGILELFLGIIIQNVSLWRDTTVLKPIDQDLVQFDHLSFHTVYHWLCHYLTTIYFSYRNYVSFTLTWPNWEFTHLFWIYSVHKIILEVFDTYEDVYMFLLKPCFCINLLVVFRVYKLDFVDLQTQRGPLHMSFLRLFW